MKTFLLVFSRLACLNPNGYFTNFFELYIFGALKHWYVLWFASNNAVRVILTLRAFRACALKGLNAL